VASWTSASAVRIDRHLLTPGGAVISGAEVLAVGPTAPIVTLDLEPTQVWSRSGTG
jgi:hypothetical protein